MLIMKSSIFKINNRTTLVKPSEPLVCTSRQLFTVAVAGKNLSSPRHPSHARRAKSLHYQGFIGLQLPQLNFTSNAVVTCKVHIDLLVFLALEVIIRICLRKSTLHVGEVKPNLG